MNKSSIFLPNIIDGVDKSSQIKNRIRKNYRHIRKWANRTMTDCFRIYDRDIKEYPLTIDFYAGRFCINFFSYDRDRDEPSKELKEEIEQVLYSIFESKADNIYWKTRIKRKRIQQYEKIDEQNQFFTAFEYGVKFRINLYDYLDTGLFLDHRETRRLIRSIAKGKRVLNLFAYTCSFSVHAALAGASYTKSVDMSNTYTDWGKENFIINSIELKNNDIVRADCIKYLDDAFDSGEVYDIIVIDPPTISRSKKMDQIFDIQKDHSDLIKKASKLLSPSGIIFFSTNSRRFKFDDFLFSSFSIKEITDKTIPLDFHNKKIHRCWQLASK